MLKGSCMPDRDRAVVEEALAAWRAAERALDETGPDAAERPARFAAVAAARAAYQRAVLASQGRLDELEAASDRPWVPIASVAERREGTAS
jgi:hypothetical protein